MALQHTKICRSTRLLISALLVGTLVGAAGCAVNPVFAHRFDHCMSYWQGYERGPQMTVYPEGQEMVGYCMDWANQEKGISVLADSAVLPNTSATKEG